MTPIAVALAVAFGGVGCGASEPDAGPVREPGLTNRVPAVVRGDCRLAARRLTSGAVYCPPIVPRGKTWSQNRSSRGRVSIDARDGEYTLNFVADSLGGFDPGQPPGQRRHHGHWLIRAQDDVGRLAKGPGTRVVDELTIHGAPVTVVERRWVAYDLDAGHVLAIWPFGERTFEISVHGFENRDLLLAMVDATIDQMNRCGAGDQRSGGACRFVYPARGQ